MGEENNLTSGQRACMLFYPCSYFCKPDLASSDCCLCCHEKPKADILDIPPLIEMSSTWINAHTPIPKWFIFTRFLITILVIFIVIFNFSLYVDQGNTQYWFIYFTQWNNLLAAISMVLKSVSTGTIHYLLTKSPMFEQGNPQQLLYTHELEPNTALWRLHIVHDIFLQTTIPGNSLVVFKLILCFNRHINSTIISN